MFSPSSTLLLLLLSGLNPVRRLTWQVDCVDRALHVVPAVGDSDTNMGLLLDVHFFFFFFFF